MINSKYKYLAKNVGLLTISNFASGILGFFLVPLYTNILSTADYGIYDIYCTTIALLLPILTLDILEATMRFWLDKKANKKAIFSVTVKYLTINFLIICLLLAINHYFKTVEIIDKYYPFFLLIYIGTVLLRLLTYVARGLDLVKTIAIAGFISTIASVILNVVFLLLLHMGLRGYFLATIGVLFLQVFYLTIKTRIWNYFRYSCINDPIELEMRKYSTPLILNDIGWWINSAADRYVVAGMIGLAENGIYSVASKIPQMLRMIQSIFEQAWLLSSVKDFDPKDESGFFSNLYNIYSFIMTLMCSGVILFDRPLAHFLYSKGFYSAWRYVPFLTIAIIFSALSGFLGGIFSAAKDSKFSYLTIIGAFTNLVLNILLVQRIGALGAAIATAVSSWLVWLLRIYRIKRFITLKLHVIRDHIAVGLLIAQAIILLNYVQDTFWLYVVEFLLLLTICAIYIHEIIKLKKKVFYKARLIINEKVKFKD